MGHAGVLLGVVLAVGSTQAGSASGFALTFDGLGSDIASVRLSADVFRGASGLTMSTWIRAFGLQAAPFRGCALTMRTPISGNWFRAANR
eukprot:1693307-Prymnesium_polylepis.1